MITMAILTQGILTAEVELDLGGRYVVGRSPDCDIVLSDVRVSRKHFEISVDDDGTIRLEKLGSKNPVYLNGFPRDNASLGTGDVVTVGQTTLRLAGKGSGETPRTEPSSVRLRGDLDSTQGERLSISALETDLGGATEPGRLDALYQLSETFVRCHDLDELFDQVLAHSLEHLPAQRGFIALGDPHQDQFEVVKVVVPESGDRTIDMSDTILEEIQERRESILMRDPASRLEATADDSIRSIGIEAFMCAPMLVHEEFVGLLYVDQNEESDRSFQRHDLQYLQSVARLLALALDDRLMREHLERENVRMRDLLRRKSDLIAECPPMLEVLTRVSRAAPRESSVLILGETGTGKERIARLLHDQSPRSEGPFVAFNCALSSPELIESELFGHRRGAFTDASRDRKGRLELANGGALLLDEIGDMPLETQVKLLRALQERQVWPVGSEEPVEVDIRLLAATHCDLDALRRKGKFRDDFFYRIAVLTLEVPPLRDRGDDIIRIAESCLPEEVEIDAAAKKALLAYAWPGNIREVQNAMEHGCLNAPADVIRLHDLPPQIASVGRRDRVETKVPSLREMELRHIRRALEAFGGNKKRTAEALGISRETLYQKIKTHGL